MSTPIPEPAAEEIQAVEGVILKSPRVRGIVASTAGVIGLGLTATTAAFASLSIPTPPWLLAAYAVYGVLAPAGFGIWKANIH